MSLPYQSKVMLIGRICSTLHVFMQDHLTVKVEVKILPDLKEFCFF